MSVSGSSTSMYQFDNKRVIVSTGGTCPIGCQYCYTYSPKFVGFPKRSAVEILSDLSQHANKFDLVQLGYDTELFLPDNVTEAVSLIRGLAHMGKDVSFSTRMNLREDTITELASIYGGMRRNRNTLVAFTSIIGYETARELEKNAPDPEERVDSLGRLHDAGVPSFVFIRPLMPVTTDTELDRLFRETEERSSGYVIGKVYYDRKSFERKFGLHATRKQKMNWALDRREWNVHIDERIAHLSQREKVFATSEDAVDAARKQSLEDRI